MAGGRGRGVGAARRLGAASSSRGAIARRTLPRLLVVAASVVIFYGLLVAVPLLVVAAMVFAAVRGAGWVVAFTFPLGVLLAASRHALWAAIPRGERPEPPGLDAARLEQPRLWRLVESVAAAAQQRPPDRVRIVFGGSAAAFERGRLLDRERTRVVVIPFSYLCGLATDQLAAVVAHELGHLAAGDTALARWIDAAANALRRSVGQLERYRSILRRPFRAYARWFFRWSAGLSRRQELAADALWAFVCGRDAAAGALRVSRGLGVAFDGFWAGEVIGPLDSGLRPPLGEGFRFFLGSVAGQAIIAGAAEFEPGESRFASHPADSDRIALISASQPAVRLRFDGPAYGLLEDEDGVERALLAAVAGERDRPLRECSWNQAALVVGPPAWTAALAVAPIDSVATVVAELAQAFQRADQDEGTDVSPLLVAACACALALALLDDGWSLSRSPGDPSTFDRGGVELTPRREIEAIAAGDISEEAWRQRCDELEIGGLPLPGPAAQPHEAADLRPPETRTGEASLAPPAARVFILDDHDVNSRRMWFYYVVVMALALPSAGAFLFVPFPAGTSTSGVIAARAAGVVIAALIMVGARARYALTRRPPSLTVDGSGLTLTHTILLREPLRIPADAIELVAIDGGAAAPAPDVRFPVYAEGAYDTYAAAATTPRGWVWPAARARLPLYAITRDTPNVLVLLGRELPGPRVRRERLHGPLNGESLRGFVVRVRDPDATAAALRAAELLRPLTTSDLPRAFATPASVKRRRTVAAH